MENTFEKIHHYMGIELNQKTWKLLEKKARNDTDNHRMLAFAKASLYHWQNSQEFQLLNEQRGEWMISHVFSVLGKGEEALARTHGASGHSEKMNEYFLKAKDIGKQIEGNKDKEIFLADLHFDPWFECTKPMDDS
ncbi:MAG: hypothetical protein HOE56_05710 [Candidatus Marinimicrobia bacterium]|nr:hypothetical protein [Candidatus Neomarinimicrobiota bacterium]